MPQSAPNLAQAAHGGDTNVRLYWNTSQARDVFYARYIDWFITTPLLLLDLLLLSAVPVGTVLWCAAAPASAAHGCAALYESLAKCFFATVVLCCNTGLAPCFVKQLVSLTAQWQLGIECGRLIFFWCTWQLAAYVVPPLCWRGSPM